METEDLKQFLLDVLDEYFIQNPTDIANRWQGGTLIMQPSGDTQAKEIPIEVFFRKLLTVRDSLRVLEQKINGHSSLSSEDKATMHGYITKAYGALTTFNILFNDNKDKFVGAGKPSRGHDSDQKLSVSEARQRLGLNEYGKD